jgi:hypothetical protein
MTTVIDSLDAINDKLGDWIVHTSPDPGDAAAVEQMRLIVDLHNQLDQILMKLRLADLQATNDSLAKIFAEQGARLGILSGKVAKTEKHIKMAENVISYAAQAVAAAAKLATLLC